MLTIDDLEKQLSVVSREHVEAKIRLDEQLRAEKIKAKELSKDYELLIKSI